AIDAGSVVAAARGERGSGSERGQSEQQPADRPRRDLVHGDVLRTLDSVVSDAMTHARPRRDAPTCRGKADATRYGTVGSASGACEAGTDRSIAPSASKCCWRAAMRRGKLVQHAWETGIALARGRRTPASERTGRHSHASPRSLSRPGRRGALLRLTRGAHRACRARERDA